MSEPEYRVGHGFDAHRFVDARDLVLGGIRLDHPRGLQGHSDGDCLLHAVCDALLGAAGEGDLGRHFPSRDPHWKDAPSLHFLRAVGEILARNRWSVVNVDATIVAQEPALAPHLPAMAATIAEALGVGPDRVSVKAKSTDALGAVGRAEGMAALATAMLRRP